MKSEIRITIINHQLHFLIFLGLIFCSQSSYSQMNYLRTPDSRFAKLDGYNYTPHYFDVDDYEGGQLRMHYIDEGPVGAPAVIMIHGNPTWIYQFRDVIPFLNAAGYRTIAIDLMGMGRSDKPTDSSDYSYDRHVGWVTQLFTKIDSALNLGQVSIFGHDYGTPMGIRMMVEHFPKRFDAFIDANASLPDGTFISPVHFNWRQFVRDNPNVPVGHVIAGSVNNPLTPAEIYGYYAPWPDSTYKMAIRTFPEMVPDDTTRPEAIANNAAWTFMENFQKPFMTIFGQADNNNFDARRDFIERVPGAYGQPHPQLNVTHYAPEDDPVGVAHAMIQFLDDVYHQDSFVNIQFSDFSKGFDGYVSGGANCVYDPNDQSVRIQGNSGVASSMILDAAINLTSYDVLKVAFRYEAENMETGESFVVELWDGTNWTNMLTLTPEVDFSNGVWDYGFIRIERDGINFAIDAKIRFRSMGSETDDAVYIKDVGIYGRGGNISGIEGRSPSEDLIVVYPNPAGFMINIVNPDKEKYGYELFTSTGQLLRSGVIDKGTVSLDISNLPAGQYFLKLVHSNNKQSMTKKIIKSQ